jgi:hypothetical protein
MGVIGLAAYFLPVALSRRRWIIAVLFLFGIIVNGILMAQLVVSMVLP